MQDTIEKVARYKNGLRMDIEDEISLLTPRIVEESYQLALKAEDKITRRQSNRGRCPNKGRGQQFNRGISTTQREGTNRSSHQGHREDEFKERGFSPRGRGRGRGREFKCYKCGKLGHRSFECPKNKDTGSRNVVVTPTVEGEEKEQEVENIPDIGESLLLKKVLLKSHKILLNHLRGKPYSRQCAKLNGSVAR